MRSLYVHIPFCKNICSYCDFCKVYYNQQWADDYLKALKRELHAKAIPSSLYTIYIGGGTPTVLSLEQLQQLMNMLKPYTHNIQEYTIEVNPETMNEEKLRTLYNGGITRLSIGVQTFQEHLLAFLHRQHTNRDVFDVITLAKKIGFQNISIDLMYGIPHQTKEDIQNDLNLVKTLDIQHVSYYSLILEEHTLLSIQNYQPLDDQIEADYYEMIEAYLKKMGFEKYEVSNFAKKKYQSLHNCVYWEYGNYEGVGLGAHSIVEGQRFENTRSLTQYLKGNYLLKKEKIDQRDQMFEMVMMGLRLVRGVSSEHFKQRFQEDIFQKYEKPIQKYMILDMLVYENGFLKTTKKGMTLLHEILVDFLE